MWDEVAALTQKNGGTVQGEAWVKGSRVNKGVEGAVGGYLSS